ncbi:hypothetical protein [Capnocytophaga sputigena]|jgi:hypothetical protein|uniref:hypothetical protein n=1 Tax=Capnocytophaga sputigena TaxID=1019 RepID=UPI002888FBF1|nr:hypothetical protein [Capnocytophaga sputigena]
MSKFNKREELLNRVNFSSTEEMVSLNEAANQDFFVEQLEERLETDPLMVGGLFDLIQEESVQTHTDDWCGFNYFSCGEYSCFIHF